MSRKAPKLTAAQSKMYAGEKLANFRFIAKILASYSSYTLTDKDLVATDIELELAEIGQYTEIASNNIIPVSFVLDNIDKMVQPDFPLEGYEGLRGSVWVAEYFGSVSHLHSYVACRPQSKQLISATSGTCSVTQAMQDLRTLYHRPRSGHGVVHSGFWALYKGVRDLVYTGIAKGFREHPDTEELVITGHSMGGAVAYLLIMDVFLGKIPLPPNCKLKLVSFGAPRVGNEYFVKYWRDLRESFQHQFTELCVKAYNDGVPSLPPLSFGYRHFTENPLYLMYGRLYHVPPSECEYSLFVCDPVPLDGEPIEHPKGGHNYYNKRDMERVIRRLQWLDKSMFTKDDWVMRYQRHASKHLAPSVSALQPAMPSTSSSLTLSSILSPKKKKAALTPEPERKPVLGLTPSSAFMTLSALLSPKKKSGSVPPTPKPDFGPPRTLSSVSLPHMDTSFASTPDSQPVTGLPLITASMSLEEMMLPKESQPTS